MKFLFLLLSVLCVAGVYASANELETYSLRHLLKRARASSKASAKSTSTGGKAKAEAAASSTNGTATAVAEATSESFTKVENDVKEYFKYVFDHVGRKRIRDSKEKYCRNALAAIEKNLKAVGSVTASAYTEALAEVEVTGTGEACGSASASAKSSADGYAKILVDAITEASYSTTHSMAEARVQSIIHVIADAFSKAFAVACIEGEGDAIALQTSLAEAVIKPVATVSILVASGVNCEDQAGYSRSEVEAGAEAKEEDVRTEVDTTTEIRGKGTAEAGGETEAFTAVLEKCSSKYALCCRSRYVKDGKCYCSRTRKRCNAEERKTKDGTKFWADDDKEVYCVCGSFFGKTMPTT